MNQVEQSTLHEGIRFRSVRDTKFKTFRISVNFLLPLQKDTAAANALLPFLLSRCSRAYPDFTLMSRKLASLYGASLGAEVGKLGNLQVLTVSASGIAERYALENEHLAAELTEVLCGALFDPALENGRFREEDFRQEQRQTLEQLDAEFSDKRAFALTRCTEIMCADEPFGLHRFGSRDAVEHLTVEQVTQAWRQMLQTARVEILALGDLDPQPVAKRLAKAFDGVVRQYAPLQNTVDCAHSKEISHVTDRQDVVQGKMVLGLRVQTSQRQNPELVPAARLMSAIFGGTPNSKLFLNVREKMSLCYYCASLYNSMLGLMFVQSGVEFENMEKAEQAILEQLKAVQGGEFTDADIAAAKLSMVNNYNGVADSLSALEGWYLSQSVSAQVYTPEAYAKLVQDASREDIVRTAQGVYLDTVYCLKGQKEAAQ
ncbi:MULTISPECIES: EF-P 5-aminopentanol modification-associated protein YfmF [Caproicibacterium]|uniref:Pitrilysin family protein n=1 Tax=Caproicibacterium argilliputei TaxID=3030016 RepID=A0AA97D8J3_9FIRM|nr:pitrilysin family protein [Caproicibacterium argilliputei]WOC31447.1 pitrilysin family protein [Caproicibacterium argilliputei]